MKYRILRNKQLVAEVSPQGSLTEKLFGEETLEMSFALSRFVTFEIGDEVSVFGKKYYITTAPSVDKISSREFRYSLVFNGAKYKLSEVQFFFYDKKNKLTMPDFSIMGNARKILEVIVANANRTMTGWSVGEVNDTEVKNLDFSGDNCLSALVKVAEAFDIEFWIDADLSIHLTERKTSSGYSFEYGRNKGVKNIKRTPYTEASLVTRLYVKGSDKNLPKGYRDGQKNLRMKVPYIERNTNLYGVIEQLKTFEEIYPHRVGTVTQVYDSNPYQFTDSTLDFDLNAYNSYGTTALIAGVSAKVIFQTGDLAGYTLEIKEYGYNSATKTFTLKKNDDERLLDIPSDTLRPKVGDKYILVDVMMPESYVKKAEAALMRKAVEYLHKNSVQRHIYTITPDRLYMEAINANIQLGQTVRFKDADFNLNAEIRIVSLTKNIQNPKDISFEIAETATITAIVRNYIEKEKVQSNLRKEQNYNAQMARRSYLFAKELQDNVFDNEGYFDTKKIKPLSIETGMLSVGSRAQQFSLPDVALTLSEDKRRLRNTAGRMVHLTIDPKAPRTWTIAQNESAVFSEGFNYIYLKADRVGTNAVFVVTQSQIMLESDPVFYHFLVGSVSSIIDGVRRIKTLYGYTQITPSEITTGRISSANGQNYIDLLQDKIEINAKVSFASDSPAIKQVADTISVGGRNLAKDSEQPKWNPNNSGLGTSAKLEEPDGKFVRITPGSGKAVSVFGYFISDFESGKFSRSMWFRHFHTGSVRIWEQEVPSGRWVLLKDEGYSGVNRWNGFTCDTANVAIDVKKFKCERGTKCTDWTPAPEDVAKEIAEVRDKANQLDNLGALAWKNAVEKAQLGNTIIEGGYLKTELINAAEIVSRGGGVNSSYVESIINSLALGVRNLAKDSELPKWNPNNAGLGASVEMEEPEGKFVRITPDSGKAVSVFGYLISDFESGKFSRSMWFRHFHTGSVRIWGQEVPSGRWVWLKDEGYSNVNGWNGFDSNTVNVAIDVKKFKSERGTKCTDWAPAPEDYEAEFAAIQAGVANLQTTIGDVKGKTDNFTSIQGGLISTNVIAVGDSKTNQNAVISGVTDAGGLSVRFAAGAPYSAKDRAPWRVYDNGKMVAENATISGEITAYRGSIGNFKITNGYLITKSEDNPLEMFSQTTIVSLNNIVINMIGRKRDTGELNRENYKSIILGRTTAPSADPFNLGPVARFENHAIQKDFFPYSPFDEEIENIALLLSAKNGKKNFALDMPDGGVRTEGKEGISTKIKLIEGYERVVSWNPARQWEKSVELEITNGIITGLKRSKKEVEF